MYYNFCLISECYVSLSDSVQSSLFFSVLNASFFALTLILSLSVACLPVCVKMFKQLRTQTLHTVPMEFPETRSSILVHTISECSHNF